MKAKYLILAALVIGMMVGATSCKKETPTEPETPVTPDGIDYSKTENWMILPTECDHEVDVFFIYYTCAANGTDTTVYLSDSEKVMAYASYLEGPSAFSEYTNIFAPYYRQIPFSYVPTCCETNEDYVALLRRNNCKTDIFAALDYYFAHYNNGRPFMLAGHSQGSALIRIVLDEYMTQHPEYMQRMVAAYAIGFALPESWFAANPHLKKATGEKDTGVVIGWNTEGPDATKPNWLLSDEGYLINPLTWTTDDVYAPASKNLGTFKWTSSDYTTSEHYYPGTEDAQIDPVRRSLICTTTTEYANIELFGDKSMHSRDWSFYYDNIRVNGRKRIEAFLGHSIKVETVDYSKAENWLRCGTDPSHEVDVIHFVPTIVVHSEDAPVAMFNDDDKLVAEASYQKSAKTLEACANVYVPYYRQVYSAVVGQCATAEQLENYVDNNAGRDDAFAALDYYFEHYNNGKPFIISGHSQGSAITKLFFEEYFVKHPDYYQRMIASYSLGFSLPQKWYDENPLAKPATCADDLGVIIGWNTEGSGCTEPSRVIGENEVLINPLTWTTDDTYAGVEMNLGSYKDGEVIVPGIADVQIDHERGALICTTVTEGYTTIISPLSFHGEDWAFYYMNIRDNAITRMTKYLGHEPR